jgi:hypothetical protein
MKRSLLLAPAALGLCLAAAAQSEGDLSKAAERWRSLEPTRRAEIQERFDRFRELDEAQREALRERARGLLKGRRELLDRLPASERQRLEGLAPFERDEVLRSQQMELERRRGARLRDAVPPPLLDHLQQADPHDRLRLLHHWRDGMRERHLGRGRRDQGPRGGAGEALRGRLGMSREDFGGLDRLPKGERIEALRDAARQELGRGRRLLPESVLGDRELMREVLDAAIPTVEEIRALGGELAPRDLRERGRERVLSVLRASGRLTAEELAELEALSSGKLLADIDRALPPPPFEDGRRDGRGFPGPRGDGRPPHAGPPPLDGVPPHERGSGPDLRGSGPDPRGSGPDPRGSGRRDGPPRR